MQTEDLKEIRVQTGLTQDAAMQLISAASNGLVSTDRRHILRAEKYGTRDLFLLEGMSAVYDVPFERLRSANIRLWEKNGKSVQKTLQKA